MALLVTCSLVAPVRAADPTAPELARALQDKYDSVKDFSADFTHAYAGGVLKRKVIERGQLVVKKPGKMRWEYKTPNAKLFVSDGVRIHFYVPEDKQVVVSQVPPDDQANTPALFLAGKGNLVRDFTASFAEPPSGMPPGSRALKLVPKTRQPEYDALLLTIDPATLALRGLQWVDPQGGVSTFSFTNMKENIGVVDKQFAFNVPRGVDVVTDSSAR
jgi:outer membrane lipoprotein carrier protein